ncbi:hypothetical protein EJF18_10906 [Clavispora lusitaniae]|uniref:Uncharacterized protein n=1 Tax=Clavispora lusitaniae TaxID=36911 RepID=A0ACD0WEV2_CLALS|nr:hypothetical protein EJF14_10906 [Clavispora lusitaniae]QFZ30903.1 hypothetical protein EJF16_10906 [Clavispora lusitaniae]QFZ36571.1 hypothetical protein EJF15_10906 [Clavispora lusitaniae]QFZ42255.1 hypothetical protein EJF18_10906 [Clavispora lusitaniae]QFZ47931.1 hypothetical protein EJF17_10906 [Clavispora lusitaniae]
MFRFLTTALLSVIHKLDTYILIVAIAYIIVLFSLNCIPHVRVKYIGWFSLNKVTLEYRNSKVVIGNFRVRLNFLLPSSDSSRIINVYLSDVSIIQSESPQDKQQSNRCTISQQSLIVDIPSWIYTLLIRDRWLKEFAVHVGNLSISHFAMGGLSVQLSYTRLESLRSLSFGTHGISLTVLDGFIHDNSRRSTVDKTRVVRNLEVELSSEIYFTCPLPKEKSRIRGTVNNFGLKFIVADVHIPDSLDLSQLQKSKQPNLKEPSPSNLPDTATLLALFNLISFVQIKVEESVVSYNDLRVESSSYSFNYTKDYSYKKQLISKISFYVTAGQFFHLDSKCMEIPSLTYLFEANISDFQSAILANISTDHCVDISSNLTLANPNISIFFDQLGFLLNTQHNTKRNKQPIDWKNNKFFALSKKIRNISTKVLIMDTKMTLHMPQNNSIKFHRESSKNIVSNGEMSSLAFKSSSKNLGRLIERKCFGYASPLTLKGYMRMKNLRLEVEKNELLVSNLNSLIGYCVDNNSVSLKFVSKHVRLKSVNTMIFHVVRLIRETRRSQMNAACADIAKVPQDDSSTTNSSDSNGIITSMDIFEVLPSVIRSVRFESKRITTTIICNDSLPSHILKTDEGEMVDLSSFKRGISFTVNDVSLTYKKSELTFKVTIRHIQVNTLSEYMNEYVDEVDDVSRFDVGEIDFEDVSSLNTTSSHISDQGDNNEIKKVKRVLFINDIVIENPANISDRILISIPEVDGKIDVFLIWCVMYAHTLVEMIAPKVSKTYSVEEESQVKKKNKRLNLSINIDSLALTVKVPNNVDLMFECDQLQLRIIGSEHRVQVDFLRLYVVHPATKLWTRLVSITDLLINLNNLSKTNINLVSKTVRFNIPFQFLVYTVIDNIVTFFKTIRQLKYNFKNLSQGIYDYQRIMPEGKPAFNVPRISWKSSIVGLTLENDAFEAELALIFELASYEQVDRLRKLALFEQKVKDIKSKVDTSVLEEHVPSSRFLSKHSRKQDSSSRFTISEIGPAIGESFKSQFSNMHSRHSEDQSLAGSKAGDVKSKSFFKKSHRKNNGSVEKETYQTEVSTQNEEVYTEECAAEIINRAKEALDKDFGTSWIQKFRKFKETRYANIRDISRSIWDEDEVNPIMKSKFSIQNFAPGTPQFTGLFKDFDLAVETAKINDIDEFLRLHGKGQPKLEYSILIPLFFRLRSSSVSLRVRDYALPALSFPSNSGGRAPIMDFSGNLVINEKLVFRKEEMRHIFVPFSPAITKEESTDNFYSVHIPRTLTPVKFMLDLQCNINTDRACIISWSKSYQAAMSSVMQAFDNFTKPPIDDSPLGWWDKFGLLIHGKIKFNIENELCLHIKSSISPYELVGENSGFVFCWKNGVSLRINETNNPAELILLDSHDFILGIPNYSTAESRTWSLFYNDTHDYVHESEYESKKFQKRVLKFSSDEKVLWTLGFAFERNCDKNATELSSNQERTSKFKPHYDVVVTNPIFDWHPDSYEEYRSDYLHMAISVCSKSSKGNCSNSAYLTPRSIKYFTTWWNTLTNTISLPIREGKLFSSKKIPKSSVKMSPHLFTFKYQLEIEPLTISNLHLSFDVQNRNYNVIFTGLKGKVARCVIDLHQRKEVVRYVNDKLGIDKMVRKLKLNLGEIDITDADIRLFYAKFSDTSLRGELMSYYTGDSSTPIDIGSFQANRESSQSKYGTSDWKKNMSIKEEDFPWLDLEDFIELEEKEMLSADPAISVHPFFFTPRFTYFREFTLESSESKFPFGAEKSHRCLIGAQTPDQVQAMILKRRVDEIKQELEDTHDVLSKLDKDDSTSKQDYDRLNHQIDRAKRAISHVTTIYEDVASTPSSSHNSRPASLAPNAEVLSKVPSSNMLKKIATSSDSSIIGVNENGSFLTKMDSRAFSAYSNYKSMEQAREVMTSNASASSYHNRFLIHNLQLVWNNKVRNLFMEYLLVVNDEKTQAFAMSKKAVDLVDGILKKYKESDKAKGDESSTTESSQDYDSNEDIINCFEEYLTHNDSDDREIENKYLIKFIRPQAQFISELDTNLCVLQTSQDVELRIICVNVAGTNNIISENQSLVSLIATRYGVFLKDSFAFAFERKNFTDMSLNPYGNYVNRQTWPPWVNCEECDEVLNYEEDLVLERTTMAFTFEKPNMLSVDATPSSKANEIKVHLGKVVFNATSSQYSAMYFVVTDLLMHSNSGRDQLHRRLKQIMTLSDESDFQGISEKVKQLQQNIRVCRFILLKMDERTVLLSKKEQREKSVVEMEMERMKLELGVIVEMSQLVGDNNAWKKDLAMNWKVDADQVIWHILDDNREPLVDFALAASQFSRVDKFDGSNSNLLEISMIQGFNLQPKAVYPELFRPYLEVAETNADENVSHATPIVQMSWEMLNPVGGIKVMKNAELKIQPVHIQVDHDTANKIFNYMFPKEDESSKESSSSSAEEELDDSSSATSNTSPESSNPFRKLMAKKRSPSINSSHSNQSSRHAHSAKSEDFSVESSSVVSSSDGTSVSERLTPKLKRKSARKAQKEFVDDVSLIMNRSSKYIVIEELKVHKVRMCISFKAPKHLNIIDVHNLQVLIPTIHYQNKTWSGHELAMHLKKDVIRIVLNHAGKIIGNKFKHRHRKKTGQPLKQISDYSQYMTLEQLQEEGRPRNGLQKLKRNASIATEDSRKSGSHPTRLSPMQRNVARRPVDHVNMNNYLDSVSDGESISQPDQSTKESP